MAIFNFFKTPKIRQYHHEYIYYDPAKEKREERLKRVREEIENEKEGKPNPVLRKGVFHDMRKTNKTSVEGRNIKLMLLVGVVALLVFWYMK